MSTRAYDLVMFDLDGTLVETGPEIADATNDTLSHFGWATVTQEQVNAWIGHGTRELLLQAMAFVLQTPAEDLRHSDRFAQAEAVFIGHYQSRCGTRSHLYPQVLETLSALRQRTRKGVTPRPCSMPMASCPCSTSSSAVTPYPRKSPTQQALNFVWRTLGWMPRGLCSWSIPASMFKPPATPAWRFGHCLMATTWGNPLKPANPTG
jgi:hypothetical protein